MSTRALRVEADGRIPAATYVSSPNFDRRPPGASLRLVVLHAISLPPDEFGGPGILELFTNRLDPGAHPYYRDIAGLRVSAHFLIRRNGALYQFVSCADRAWHAGKSSWRGVEGCNDYSVGIELEGCDTVAFESAQYEVAAALTRALQAAYPILDVVAHSDVAPGRKTDPGPHFDWRRYHRLIANVNIPPSSLVSA